MSEQSASTTFRRTCATCGATVATTEPGEPGVRFYCTTACFLAALGSEPGKQQCAHVTNGPKMGKNVMAWRKRCRRMVKDGDYCWQHRGEHYARRVR